MNKLKSYGMAAAGILILVLDFFLFKAAGDPEGFMQALPYVSIGLGCGMFGHGMGTVVSDRTVRRCPAIQRQMEIEKQDERNIAISNCAKAKAYDLSVFVFGALLIAFALMGVPMEPVLLLVFAYLFVQGYAVYYRFQYEKQM